MYILALDSAANSLSIALSHHNKIIGEETIAPSSNQSEILIPKVQEMLEQNNLYYEDLGLITTTNGPGSFTGSRIALTAARMIRLSTQIPIIILNSCQVIAFKHREKLKDYSQIFVALDARSNEIFYASYKSNDEIISTKIMPQITKINNIQEILPKKTFYLCGSGATLLNLEQENDQLEAKYMCQLARELHEKNHQNTDLNPLYLRSPKITARKK